MSGPPSAPRGRRVGRYVLGEEIGRGGMGAVFRAEDPRLRRAVAIKLLAGAGGADDARRHHRFLREAQAAGGLRHPGIVAVHEIGDHAGQPFLVMDLIDGEDLDSLRARGPLPPRRVAEIVRDVARALEHAHVNDVVHRDVKPQNVLIDRDGHALLVDFGLARPIDGASALTRTGQLLGTPQFLAPEQARGEVGPLADVWALGGLLYATTTGRPPFDGETIINVLQQVLQADPVPPRQIDARIHPDLETIALRCLEKDPASRYPSAAAVADELERFLAGEAILARPLRGAARVRRWVRRNRLLAGVLLGATLLVLGTVAAAAVAVVSSNRRLRAERDASESARRDAEAARARASSALADSERDRDRAEASVLQARQSLATAFIEKGTRLLEDLDVPGARLLFAHAVASHDDRRAREHLLAARQRWDRVAWTRRFEDSIRDSVWSGDVLVTSGGHHIRCWDGRTGRLLGASERLERAPDRLLALPGGRIATLAPPGRIAVREVPSARAVAQIDAGHSLSKATVTTRRGLIAWAGPRGLVVWNPLTDDRNDIRFGRGAARPGEGITAIAFAPDDQLAIGTADGAVALISGADESSRSLGRHAESVRGLAWSPDGRRLLSTALDGALRLYEPGRPDDEPRTLETDDGKDVLSAVFSPDGSHVVFGDADGRIWSWEADNTFIHILLLTELDHVDAVAFDPSGRSLAWAGGRFRTTGHGGSLGLLDLASIASLPPRQQFADGVAWSPRGQLAVVTEHRALEIWDPASARRVRAFPLSREVDRIAWSRDGRRIATMRERRIELLDAATGARLHAIDAGDRRDVAEASLDAAWRRVVVPSWKYPLEVLDLATGRRIGRPVGKESESGAISSDGTLVVHGDEDGTVALVGIEPPGERWRVRAHAERTVACAISPDGRLVASGGVDGSLTLRAADRPEEPLLLEPPFDDRVRQLAFSPDGRLLAGTGQDATLQLWRLSEGSPRLLARLRPDRGGAGDLAWSHDGRLLAVGAGSHDCPPAAVWKVHAIEEALAAPAADLLAEEQRWTGLRADGLDIRIADDEALRAPGR